MTRTDVMAREAFAVDDDVLTWAEVIDAARVSGEWAALERTVVPETHAELDSAALRLVIEQRATAFRYDRGLLSADETDEWFSHWDVTVADWLAHLRRQVLGEAPPDLDAAVWLEAIVSGTLELKARRLAGSLAAYHSRGGDGVPDIAALDEAMAEFANYAAGPDPTAAIVAERSLAWTTFELSHVDLPDEGAARELLYCVRDDGRPMGEVAAEAQVSVVESHTTLEDVAGDLRALLTGAAAGDVLGPLPVDDAWRVVAITARVSPRADDEHIAARARDHLIAEAVRREMARRVRWLDPVLAQSAGRRDARAS